MVSGEIGSSIQKEVHGCCCMQASSGAAERANVGRCPAVRKLISMQKWRLNRERMILTSGDAVVRRARSFVETLDTQVKQIRVAWSQTGQLINNFCCLPLRNGSRSVGVIQSGTVDDIRVAGIPVQSGTRLLNIGG